MPTIDVPVNSLATIPFADDYLDGSVRAASWEFLDQDAKTRCLISAMRIFQRITYRGTFAAGFLGDTMTPAGGSSGSGYQVGDILTATAGAFGEASTWQVASIGGSGEVQSLTLVSRGFYTEKDETDQALSGGNGSGALGALGFIDQVLPFPRIGLEDREGNPLPADLVPIDVLYAQVEFAYELSINPDLETNPSTRSNLKRAKAGSAEVELFLPLYGVAFPKIAHDLLLPFIESDSAAGKNGTSLAFANDLASGVDEDPTRWAPFPLSRGID